MGISKNNPLAVDNESRALTPLAVLFGQLRKNIPTKKFTEERVVKSMRNVGRNSTFGVNSDYRSSDSIGSSNYKVSRIALG